MKIQAEPELQERTEQFALKQIEKKTVFIGSLRLVPGHRVFQINTKTLEVCEAEYETKIHYNSPNKRKIITKEGFQYIMALNKKNALKKFHRGY